MSLRKRPPVLDDRFESTKVGTYDDLPDLNTAPQESEYRQHVPNLTVPQAIEVLTILLWDYQCKGKLIETHGADQFRMWFPFAWHTIRAGDLVKNMTTHEVYVVDSIVADHQEYKKNFVILRGKTPPQHWHTLRFDNKKGNLVTIMPAYPDTENKPYEFTKDGYLQQPEGDVWVDVITYTISMEAPGSLGGQMFGPGSKERKPRFREESTDTRFFGQWIDTRVRFDFWTQTNAGSERLREWFRDFSNKYRWLIEKNGVNRFMWQSSGSVSTATRWKGYIIHRSAYYDFRTEYSIYTDMFKIRSGDLQVAVPGDNGTDVVISSNF